MVTNIGVANLQNEEPPPSYHSLFAAYSGVHNQSYSNPVFLPEAPAAGAFTVGHPDAFAPPTEFPPPYFPASNILVGPTNYRNNLEDVLSAHQKLTLQLHDTEIRGSQNQLVLSTSTTTSTALDGDLVSCTVKFSDAAGKVLITSLKTGQQLRISSGHRILGLIIRTTAQRAHPISQRPMWTGLNCNGEVVFLVEEQRNGFKFLINGATVALARKCRLSLGLEFTAPVDGNTRAMMIAISYDFLFLSRSGTSCDTWWMIFILLASAIIGMIIVITYYT